ncbi:class I SAM-dependent methyltransferase [Marinobacter sp.]|uniref:class I SAM-dependent methyltransferase n=1 Tax=Marinobacter sp. TaxID=50741 RepID=UPI0025832239|nr:class I SAM-dependent methyltransferase [Marinobacter sp.]MCW9010613.1 class I SAM-dependent methyltransferase [Marinobacter sp.]
MSAEIEQLKASAYSEFGAGNYKRAAELLLQVESVIGSYDALSNDIAVAQFKHGDFESAINRFREASELQANTSRLILDNLVEVMKERGAAKAPVIPPEQVIARHLSQTYCPLCNAVNQGFRALPEFYRKHAEDNGFKYFGQGEMTAHDSYTCASCGASDRERLYAYWLSALLCRGELSRDASVMHFAPEPGFSRWLKQIGFADYQTADFAMQGVDHRVDLMDLPFDANSLDFFVCSHVLEHVQDDAKALSELFRVLRPGCSALLMVPIICDLDEIDEDPAEEREAERWRRFGQGDHVRLYNREGYVSRVQNAGFRLQLLDVGYFGAAVYQSLGLKKESVLYVVTKPEKSDQ